MTTIVVTATRHQARLPRITTNPRTIPAQGRHTSVRTIIPNEFYALEYYTALSDRPLRTEYYPTEADAEHASRRSSTLLWRLGAEHLDTIKEIAE